MPGSADLFGDLMSSTGNEAGPTESSAVDSTSRVTIGMPVRNGAAFLEEALQSIVRQTYADFCVVISDNASEDDTQEICRHYAAHDPRISYYRQVENIGAAANYNFVVSTASTPYFKWAAHDDVLEPRFLETCVDALDTDRAAVLAYAKTALIDTTGTVTRTFEDRLDLSSGHPNVRLFQFVIRYGLSNCIFGVIRRDPLMGTRLIQPYRGSDYILLVELAMRGKFIEVPECLFRRRRHLESSVVANERAGAVNQWFDPKRKTRDRFVNTRLFWEHVSAVHTTKLPVVEKLLCYPQCFVWLMQRGRNHLGRYKLLVKDWFHRRQALLDR